MFLGETDTSHHCDPTPKSPQEELRMKVRELYLEGRTYLELAREFKIGKSRLSQWLSDIARSPKRSVVPIESFPAEHPYLGYTVFTSTDKNGDVRYRLQRKDPRDIILMTRGRYRMSVKVGRILREDEIVVHPRGTPDTIDNLRLYTRQEYAAVRKQERQQTCCECGTVFERKRRVVRTCSRKCAESLRKKNAEEILAKRDTACLWCKSPYKPKSVKSRFCSTKCGDAHRWKKNAENRKPREKKKKEPRVKPQPQMFDCECVVCETPFKSRKQDAEVCFRKACWAVIEDPEWESR